MRAVVTSSPRTIIAMDGPQERRTGSTAREAHKVDDKRSSQEDQGLIEGEMEEE